MPARAACAPERSPNPPSAPPPRPSTRQASASQARGNLSGNLRQEPGRQPGLEMPPNFPDPGDSLEPPQDALQVLQVRDLEGDVDLARLTLRFPRPGLDPTNVALLVGNDLCDFRQNSRPVVGQHP